MTEEEKARIEVEVLYFHIFGKPLPKAVNTGKQGEIYTRALCQYMEKSCTVSDIVIWREE